VNTTCTVNKYFVNVPKAVGVLITSEANEYDERKIVWAEGKIRAAGAILFGTIIAQRGDNCNFPDNQKALSQKKLQKNAKC